MWETYIFVRNTVDSNKKHENDSILWYIKQSLKFHLFWRKNGNFDSFLKNSLWFCTEIDVFSFSPFFAIIFAVVCV